MNTHFDFLIAREREREVGVKKEESVGVQKTKLSVMREP